MNSKHERGTVLLDFENKFRTFGLVDVNCGQWTYYNVDVKIGTEIMDK